MCRPKLTWCKATRNAKDDFRWKIDTSNTAYENQMVISNSIQSSVI